MGGWIAENWFTILSAVSIVGGLLYNAVSLRHQTKTQRIANLLTLTQNHRELWSQIIGRPALARVLNKSADLKRKPITVDEEIFVNQVIQHLNSAHYALTDKLVIKPEGLRRDVCWFFSLPIPETIWEKTKILQNDDFVDFVEGCRNWK